MMRRFFVGVAVLIAASCASTGAPRDLDHP
jgi:hypothetical protein